MATERQWNIRVDVFEDASIAVRVSVDSVVLEPMLECETPKQGLSYVEAVLVDVRRGDCVTGLLVAARGPSTACVVPSKDMALNWLAPALIEAWHDVRLAAHKRSATASTGIHAIVEQPEDSASTRRTGP